jgi:hypothetical protein
MELEDLVILNGMVAFKAGTFDTLCGMHKLVSTSQIHITWLQLQMSRTRYL